MFKFKIKGSNKYETIENVSIMMIVFGTFLLVLGIGLSIFSPAGIPAVLAMIGSFIVFIFTVVIVLFWFFLEKS